MNIFLSHIEWGPLIYGIMMFLGLWITLSKLVNGRIGSFLLDIIIFTVVFKMHGGTMAGGFSAMIAAMLAGIFFPRLFFK